MTLHEILSPQSKHKLDLILVELCGMIISAQRRDPDYYGMVAACVLFPNGRRVYGINHRSEVGLRIHAEVAAIEACGDAINPDCTIITTLSPCNQKMADRLGLNCDHVIKEIYGIENIYCGYIDPTQEPMLVAETENPYIKKLCKDIADCFLQRDVTEASYNDPANYRGEDISKEKTLDPDIYGEELPLATVKQIVSSIMKQVDPKAKVSIKQSPEGYYNVNSEGLRLDFGITADGGDINANIVNAYSSYPGKNVVTNIFGQCFRAAEQLWGKPAKFVMSAQQDRGYGIWQHIAQKLGAEWGGSVMENFSDGKNPGRKGLAKRSGVNTKASVSSLRKTAKHSTGEKARMAHWLANMKSGRAKAQKK